MTQAELFRRLEAPLANSRWSWGSVRPKDNAVFLRVWQDRAQKHDTAVVVRLSHFQEFKDDPEDLGHQERQQQIELIRSGSACYLIMCQAVDAKLNPRKVKSFNQKEIFPGGKLVELDGETWIEMLPRIPISDLLPQ